MRRLTGEAQSKLISATLTIIVVMVVATFGIVVYLLMTGATDASVVAAQKNTDVASCRALARVPIDEARTEIEALILDYGTAATTPDRADDARVFAAAAAAKDRLVNATAVYKTALEQSATDPKGFLRDCHEANPNSQENP